MMKIITDFNETKQMLDYLNISYESYYGKVGHHIVILEGKKPCLFGICYKFNLNEVLTDTSVFRKDCNYL